MYEAIGNIDLQSIGLGEEANVNASEVLRRADAGEFDGEDGKGVTSVTPYYYLSISDTTQSGGSWSTTPQDYISDHYYWVKYHVTYTDDTTSESSPVLDKSSTSASQAKENADSAISTAAEAKTTADSANSMANDLSDSLDNTNENLSSEIETRKQNVADINNTINARTLIDGKGTSITQVMSWGSNSGLDIKAQPESGSSSANPARLNLTGDKGVRIFAEGAANPSATFSKDGTETPRLTTPLLILGNYSIEYNASDDSLFLKYLG